MNDEPQEREEAREQESAAEGEFTPNEEPGVGEEFDYGQETKPPASTEAPAAPKPSPETLETKKKKDKETSWVRENVEAIIIAIVLALILRQFVIEAFVIPTGSMAPTLFGEHLAVTCPNCGREFAVDNPAKNGSLSGFLEAYIARVECPECESRGETCLYDPGRYSENAEALCRECGRAWMVEYPESGRTTVARRIALECPNCTYEFERDIRPSDISGGHKILVNKATLMVREPRRWDVIVFKFPEDTSKNYIKRLIGLPGERLRILNGDIYVNGEIARKEIDVIRAMGYEIWNSELKQKYEEYIPWRPLDDNWEVSVERLEVGRHEGESLVEFTKSVTAALPYSDKSSTNSVNDVGIRFSFECEEAGSVVCILDNVEFAFRLELPVGGGKASLTMHGSPLMEEEVELASGEAHEVEYVNVDDRIIVILDGEELFKYDYDSNPEISGSAEIMLGTEDTAAAFENIRIYRDIYYTSTSGYATGSEFELEDDEYFALGDNSSSSRDSRAWGTVPGENLLGRGFIIFWPIPQIRFIK